MRQAAVMTGNPSPALARALREFPRRRSQASTALALAAAVGTAAVAASGCRAQSASPTVTGADSFAPKQIRRIRDFGAVGDGRADDTAALARAFAGSDRYCLDGEGRTFRIAGTLHASKSLCLRNATLAQSLVPFDTRPYIRNSCPVHRDATAVFDCGDPAVRPQDVETLRASLSVRTLYIRPDNAGAPMHVLLDHVKIDRGRYPEAGARAESAGIWIQDADGVTLRTVEVTGAGKGHALAVLRSRNIAIDGLWIHDIVWAPYAGEAPLTQSGVAAIGWNTVPIHEFRDAGENGATAAKFYGVRIQEQVTCAKFNEVHNVVIRGARISRCMARFADGDLPWQADGLDITRSSSNVVVESPVIDNVYTGMDIVGNGTGIDGFKVNGAKVSNCFTYCLKLGKQLRNPVVTNASVTNAGLAGIIFSGNVRDGTLKGATITGVGMISANGRPLVPWPRQEHVGIRIDKGKVGNGDPTKSTPSGLDLEDIQVSNALGAAAYEFAVLNKGGKDVHVRNLRASGFSRASIGGKANGEKPPVHQE
jgi:hypothetical protein